VEVWSVVWLAQASRELVNSLSSSLSQLN